MPDVLLIRPDANERDAAALARFGLGSVIDPYLTIVPAVDPGPAHELAERLAESRRGAWLIFTSPRTWDIWRKLAPEVDEALDDARKRGLEVAAVGGTTAASLTIDVDAPPLATTDDLLASLLDLTNISGGHRTALIPGSARSRETLPDGLREAGWFVYTAAVYDTVPHKGKPKSTKQVAAGAFAGIIVRSPSAAAALDHFTTVPEATIVFAVGPTTSAACRRFGWTVHELPVADAATVAAAVAEALPEGLE